MHRTYLTAPLGFAALALLGLASTPASANQIVLEGSDATAFHHDGAYTIQLFTYMQNGSSLPVLVLGGAGLSGVGPSQAVYDTNSNPYRLSGATNYNLANYSAVYVESVGGCCT